MLAKDNASKEQLAVKKIVKPTTNKVEDDDAIIELEVHNDAEDAEGMTTNHIQKPKHPLANIAGPKKGYTSSEREEAVEDEEQEEEISEGAEESEREDDGAEGASNAEGEMSDEEMEDEESEESVQIIEIKEEGV